MTTNDAIVAWDTCVILKAADGLGGVAADLEREIAGLVADCEALATAISGRFAALKRKNVAMLKAVQKKRRMIQRLRDSLAEARALAAAAEEPPVEEEDEDA